MTLPREVGMTPDKFFLFECPACKRTVRTLTIDARGWVCAGGAGWPGEEEPVSSQKELFR